MASNMILPNTPGLYDDVGPLIGAVPSSEGAMTLIDGVIYLCVFRTNPTNCLINSRRMMEYGQVSGLSESELGLI